MNNTQDAPDFARDDAHPHQYHRAPPKTPTEPPPLRNSQTRHIILATIAMILLLLALLLDAHDNGQRTAPPTPSPTATEIPPIVAGYLTATAIATEVQQFPALERRPLYLPTLAPGESCPTVPAQRLPYPTASYGPALGQGPVYATGFHLDGTLAIGGAAAHVGGKASFTNLQWIIAPGHAGLAVVRGKQLDGTHPVRFNGGYDQTDFSNVGSAPLLPVLHLVFPDSSTIEASYIRLQALGCYAMQVDGPTFSEVIVFQAVPY